MQDAIIFHIDVNSAFLSWIAIKILAEGGSDIRLVPAVVSGDPSDRRSIVTAASIPAKKSGIKTAMPVSMALRLCPDLVIVRGDWAWYKRCSGAFMDICRSYSPVLQKFSIDECFIDMTFRVYRKDPAEVACRQLYMGTFLRLRIAAGGTADIGKEQKDFPAVPA